MREDYYCVLLPLRVVLVLVIVSSFVPRRCLLVSDLSSSCGMVLEYPCLHSARKDPAVGGASVVAYRLLFILFSPLVSSYLAGQCQRGCGRHSVWSFVTASVDPQ